MGKLIIKSASSIKKKLLDEKGDHLSKEFLRIMQIYECRFLGLCIYRNEDSYKETRKKILKEKREIKKKK